MLSLPRNRNLMGVASLCAGAFVFSVQDVIIKLVSGDHAVTLAIVIRCLVAFPILVLMVRFEAGLWRLASSNWQVMALRGALLLVAYTSYFLALPVLPLAQAVALYFTVPLIVTVLSGPMLGERVGWRSWFAVVVGFAGILVILQPGASVFEPAALLSLLSAATYALSMVLARRIGMAEPASVMAFYQNGVYLVGAAAAAALFHATGIDGASHASIDFLVRPWSLPEWRDSALMAACGVIAAAGAWLLTHAYRTADASLVTVFEYTGMIWPALWGFLLFDEIPQLSTVLGAALIVAAGVYAVRTAVPARRAAASA